MSALKNAVLMGATALASFVGVQKANAQRGADDNYRYAQYAEDDLKKHLLRSGQVESKKLFLKGTDMSLIGLNWLNDSTYVMSYTSQYLYYKYHKQQAADYDIKFKDSDHSGTVSEGDEMIVEELFLKAKVDRNNPYSNVKTMMLHHYADEPDKIYIDGSMYRADGVTPVPCNLNDLFNTQYTAQLNGPGRRKLMNRLTSLASSNSPLGETGGNFATGPMHVMHTLIENGISMNQAKKPVTIPQSIRPNGITPE